MSKPNGILAMNPENFREIDGVVFDLDSYARHCQLPSEQQKAESEQTEATHEPQHTGPAPVFAADPVHEGWYPSQEDQAPVPIMGGALIPNETCVCQDGIQLITRTVFLAPCSGSGSGSYVTSYTTSYRTSFFSSGSGSYVFGSCTYLVGGYGLELI